MFIDYFLQHHGDIYTGSYFSAYCLVAVWEAFAPRRALSQPMGMRWRANIGITLINIGVVRLFLPLLPVAVALYANDRGVGLLALVPVPVPVAAVLTFIILDGHSWLVHYLLHRVPLLWRLHAVHHSDPDYDFSTSLRFHPIEALLTVAAESLLILLLGPPALAVLCYKVVKVSIGAFAHGNLKLPDGVDGALRRVLVTPDLHRIHHSASPRETNSNFAGITPIWDRLFGTYIDQPAAGHEQLEMGLRGMQTIESVYLRNMLWQPFARRTEEPQNRGGPSASLPTELGDSRLASQPHP